MPFAAWFLLAINYITAKLLDPRVAFNQSFIPTSDKDDVCKKLVLKIYGINLKSSFGITEETCERKSYITAKL